MTNHRSFKNVYQVDNYGNAGPLSHRLVAQTLQIDVRPAARGALSFPAFHLSHRFFGNVLIRSHHESIESLTYGSVSNDAEIIQTVVRAMRKHETEMRMSVVTSLDDKHMIAKATKKRKVLQDTDHLRRIASDVEKRAYDHIANA